MKTHLFLSGIVVAATALTAAQAMAERGQQGHHRMNDVSFTELDADGDGEITRTEMTAFGEARATERFQETDTDGDGALSQAELQAAMAKKAEERATQMIKQMDKNDDGQLTQDEMKPPRRAGRMFNRMDADGSGGISQEEYDEARSHMKNRKHRRGDKAGDKN